MNNITKKIIIYSIIGMMQIGLGTAVLEASPRDDWQQQHNNQQWQENQRHERLMRQRPGENHQHWNNRQWMENQRYVRYTRRDNERQYQNELEMERHELAMQRHQNENDQKWNDRQWIENQRHALMVEQIETNVIAMFLNR